MPAASTRVLFVDDDAPLLELLRELMASYAGGAWTIFTATSPAQALTVLKAERIDLMVVDVHMPVVDGVQFLKLLHRRFPGVLKVVLTGDTTGAFRSACLNSGAELYLEKPRGQNGWQSIYATLNELVRLLPEEQGFRGVLRKVGLQDIIQIECLSRNSSILEVIAGSRHGLIYIQDGRIVHAEDGVETGVAAFFRLFAVPGGEFNLKPFSPPPRVSIDGYTWEGLLMEAAQVRDEVAPEAPSNEAAQELAEAEAAGAALEAATGSESGPSPEAEEAERRPQVDEVLICSPRGEVLYEWQCANTAPRIRLLSHLAEQTSSLAWNLPLGALERFEAASPGSRVVVQFEPAHATLVRTRQVPVLQSAPLENA